MDVPIAKNTAWSPEQEQIIYREWGLFYTKKQSLNVADLYYNKSLALNPNDTKALNFRSQCKRHIAQATEALMDAKNALALDELCQPYNLEVCDCVYELNEFEQSKYLLAEYSRKFIGQKVDDFDYRQDVLSDNFNDILGESLGYFILENGKHFDKVHSEILRQRNIDPRPLWKILRGQKKCDVVSVLEQEEVFLSPIEKARRHRGFSIFNQIYLGKSWIDVLFLKTLKTNHNLMLPQSQLSRPILESLTKSKYGVVLKMLKMLHARCPLYTKLIRNCPNKEMKEKQSERFLFCVQLQTHRNMLQMLQRMHELRSQRQLEKLQNYVEEVMGKYVVLKTYRVMPWKFEFLSEVYNIMALAYCDEFDDIPANLTDYEPKDRLNVLLKLKLEIESEPVHYEFGNRSTYRNVDAHDKKWFVHKELTARLANRLTFAKYPIERAYLWYEIAKSNLDQNGFHQCSLIAERSILEAKECNSLIWMFHSIMLICKVHALLRKIEKVSVTLVRAKEIAVELKSDKILNFLHICTEINKSDLNEKKKESERMTKSRLSIYSSNRSMD